MPIFNFLKTKGLNRSKGCGQNPVWLYLADTAVRPAIAMLADGIDSQLGMA
jgi:hypothetical protein